jgi:hypothetical protein
VSRRPYIHRRAVAGSAALVAASLIAACGASHPGSSTQSSSPSTPHTGSLSVSPAHPRPDSAITFGFTAPVSSGVHGKSEISYSLSITGTVGAGCTSAHEAAPPSVARGAHATVTVGPVQLGKPWCAGAYSARVIELRSAHCTGSAPCPQYIAVVGIVAQTRFTVSRS